MNREDEICLALQGLINGIDCETGKKVEFSEKVKESLKVIAVSLGCRERSQQINNTTDSKKIPNKNWSVVNGSFKEIVRQIKFDKPNHLVIIQNGYFYEILNEDATFFADRFSYSTFERNGETVTGFPIHSERVLQDLKDMKKSFVLVGQLPKVDASKVQRVIIDIYNDMSISSLDGDSNTLNNSNSLNTRKSFDSSNNLIIKPCKECGQDIPKTRLEASPNATRCIKCQLNFQSDKSKVACQDCGRQIPKARLEASPNSIRCVTCQSNVEEDNPELIARKTEENPIGSREDFKNMSNKQFGTNSKTKF